MAFDDFGANSFFLDKFCRRQEEIEEEPPFVAVEVVESGNDLGVLEAAVAEPLTDMGPVFLFDMGVIVFVVGARASDLDREFSVLEVADEVPVEKFRAVIAVEAEEWKREAGFDVLELFYDFNFTFAPNGALFGPSGSDIGSIEGIDEITGQRDTTMSDGIGFEESRF